MLQTESLHLCLELQRDDKRPLTEPATTAVRYVQHAIRSFVGVTQSRWIPIAPPPAAAVTSVLVLDVQKKDTGPVGACSLNVSIGSTFTNTDPSVLPHERGIKIGGELVLIEAFGAETKYKLLESELLVFKEQLQLQ